MVTLNEAGVSFARSCSEIGVKALEPQVRRHSPLLKLTLA